MPWLRVGDTSATHPIVLRALELDDADDRILNELFGFTSRCAVLAAAHKTDYIVEMGVARQVAGLSRWEALTDAAVFCGYFSRVKGEDGRPAFKIVSDDELFHMRLKEEIEWERTQRNDTRNKDLTVPVRTRDGDACRWCGRVVRWGDQKSGLGGTYDHVRAGLAAETPDDLVVACRKCNQSRGSDREAWAGRQLLPAPKDPFYSKKSINFLAENGVKVTNQKTLDIDYEGRVERFTPVVETPSKVETAPVDRNASEPRKQAPRSADSRATSPADVETPTNEDRQAIDTFERSIEQSLAEAPDFVQDSAPSENPPQVESNPVEPRKQAPGRTAPAGVEVSLGVKTQLLPISTPTDLDLPGRDGTGKDGEELSHERTVSSESSSTSHTPRHKKSKNRRRRRRRRKDG